MLLMQYPGQHLTTAIHKIAKLACTQLTNLQFSGIKISPVQSLVSDNKNISKIFNKAFKSM